jgi:hypothetical protein
MEWYDYALIGTLIIFIIWLYEFWKFKQHAIEFKQKFPRSVYCVDGDKVKSLSECLIDDCLTRHGIRHHYEDYINKDQRKFKYDWYLPDVDVYMEFFGMSTEEYKQNRKDKEKFYKSNRLTMVYLEPGDLDKLDEHLQTKLGKEIWEKVIHEKHCPNCGATLDERLG